MTLRVVVIGVGANIFASHLRGLRAVGAQIVGVQDVDAARAERVAQEIGAPAFSHVDALLAEAADVAVVLAPHPLHAELALASLEAGRHVLVEKPLAVEAAEADRMIASAERHGRLLAVALQQRTRHEVEAAGRLIASGALGQLQRADLLGTWPRRFAYFRTAPWRGSWRGEGGGVLINQGQHDLDLLVHLAGRPNRVVGWTRTRLQPIETEDTVQAIVEWPSGIVGAIHLSTVELDEAQRIEITGTGGRLRVLPGRVEVVRNVADFREYAPSDGNPYAPPETEPLDVISGGGAGGRHEDIYRNLERAVAGQEPLVAPASSALATLELANAIRLSSETRAEVALPLDRAAYTDLLTRLRATRRPAGLS